VQSPAVLSTLFANYSTRPGSAAARTYSPAGSKVLCQPIQDQISRAQPYDSQQSEDNVQLIRGSSPLSLNDNIYDPREVPSPQHDATTIYVTDKSNSMVATL
jgi:hypothetical protein